MEAALRTVYEIVTGQPMGKIVFEVSTGRERAGSEAPGIGI